MHEPLIFGFAIPGLRLQYQPRQGEHCRDVLRLLLDRLAQVLHGLVELALPFREQAKQDLERLNAESAQIIARARVDADGIITQSRADAERLREEIRQKARGEADLIVKNAERQIQLETSRAIEQIRHEAVELSVMIASKIIQRNLTKDDNERLIDEALKQVEGRKH